MAVRSELAAQMYSIMKRQLEDQHAAMDRLMQLSSEQAARAQRIDDILDLQEATQNLVPAAAPTEQHPVERRAAHPRKTNKREGPKQPGVPGELRGAPDNRPSIAAKASQGAPGTKRAVRKTVSKSGASHKAPSKEPKPTAAPSEGTARPAPPEEGRAAAGGLTAAAQRRLVEDVNEV